MAASKRSNVVRASWFFPTKNNLDQGILSVYIQGTLFKYIQGTYEICFGHVHLFILDKQEL